MPLDSTVLSSRIAQARAEAGLTQTELANGTGLDRTAIAKIEIGARGVSALELSRIAQSLGQRIEWLLTDGPAAVVSHRVRRGADASVASIDMELEHLARDIEFVLDQNSPLTLPSRDSQPVPRSATDAETLASQVRTEIGLTSDEPVPRLAERLSPIGLLIFVSDLGANGADGGTVLLKNGAVSLINGASHLGRRRLTAAHELAHFLGAGGYTVDWRISEGADTERAEALFDRFARAFLLPEKGLTSYWQSVSENGARAAAVRTASHFQVDMATLARRLLETGIVPREEANRIRTARTTQADILDYGLLVPYELERQLLPSAYERAVLALYRGERISADRALDLLRGKYEPSDLPALAAARADELWSILS